MNHQPYAADALDDSAGGFLSHAGWSNASAEKLTGDASARRYFRLRRGGQTAILMDASGNRESVGPFLQIGRHLRELGFSAPAVLAGDDTKGLLLLEDFGDDSFARLLDHAGRRVASRGTGASRSIDERIERLKTLVFSRPPIQVPAGSGRQEAVPPKPPEGVLPPVDEESLYALATDVLVALHGNPQAIPRDLRVYGTEKMLGDIELFLEWRTPGISDSVRADFRAVWREVLPLAHAVPASLLLRDYHVANLMWLPDRDGIRRAGLLDFQDAYQGPVTYDLVSLVEDARRELPEGLKELQIDRYLSRFPAMDRSAFETSLAVTAAQRHTRVLAIFERLSRLEGRHDYRRRHSPRVERRLREALGHPALAGVKRWMERHAG